MIPAVHPDACVHPARIEESFCLQICSRVQAVWNTICTWLCELAKWLCPCESPLPIVINRGDIALSSVDAFHNILIHLHPEDVARCEAVNRAWRAAIPAKEGRVWKTLCAQEHVSYEPNAGEHKRAFSHPHIPPFAFGTSRWKKHFGNPGRAPALPPCIHRKLALLKDSCTLTLIPATLNGEPFSIKSFVPLTIDKRIHLIFKEGTMPETVSASESKSLWVLMKKRPLDGSEEMTQADAKRESQLGKALWITVGIVAHYVQEKLLLFAGHPPTYMRTCDEEVDESGDRNFVQVGGSFPVILGGDTHCIYILPSDDDPDPNLFALPTAPVQSFNVAI